MNGVSTTKRGAACGLRGDGIGLGIPRTVLAESTDAGKFLGDHPWHLVHAAGPLAGKLSGLSPVGGGLVGSPELLLHQGQISEDNRVGLASGYLQQESLGFDEMARIGQQHRQFMGSEMILVMGQQGGLLKCDCPPHREAMALRLASCQFAMDLAQSVQCHRPCRFPGHGQGQLELGVSIVFGHHLLRQRASSGHLLGDRRSMRRGQQCEV